MSLEYFGHFVMFGGNNVPAVDMRVCMDGCAAVGAYIMDITKTMTAGTSRDNFTDRDKYREINRHTLAFMETWRDIKSSVNARTPVPNSPSCQTTSIEQSAAQVCRARGRYYHYPCLLSSKLCISCPQVYL